MNPLNLIPVVFFAKYLSEFSPTRVVFKGDRFITQLYSINDFFLRSDKGHGLPLVKLDVLVVLLRFHTVYFVILKPKSSARMQGYFFNDVNVYIDCSLQEPIRNKTPAISPQFLKSYQYKISRSKP